MRVLKRVFGVGKDAVAVGKGGEDLLGQLERKLLIGSLVGNNLSHIEML